jgi:GT2 family glycosyltransferase
MEARRGQAMGHLIESTWGEFDAVAELLPQSQWEWRENPTKTVLSDGAAHSVSLVGGRSESLRISVVICAYADERWSDLIAAVRSAELQTRPPLDVIVVIDHNLDLLDRVRRELPSVVAVPNVRQRGLSGARNSGIDAARGDVIAFLDDDALADQDWLETLAAAFCDPKVMTVGGAVLPIWTGGRPHWLPDEFLWVVGCTYRGMPDSPSPVRNVIGANMAFRRDVFEEVGVFTSGIGRLGSNPVGCEETELCIRARQRWPDREVRFEPRALVRHRVPRARVRWSYFRARCFAEGRSKALVSRSVGTDDGLSSERDYTFKTLPAGVMRGLRLGAWRGDVAGLVQSTVIVAGLAITTAGYLTGKALRLSPELPAV